MLNINVNYLNAVIRLSEATSEKLMTQIDFKMAQKGPMYSY